MWASVLKFVALEIILPLLKDLAFMIFNILKVRKIRKDREEAQKKKIEEYDKNPSDENYGKLP